MDYTRRLALSYYKTIATINEPHNIDLVLHQETKKIFIKKCLDVYSLPVYQSLQQNHIYGTPQIIELYEEEKQLIVIEEYIPGQSLQEKIESGDLTADTIADYLSALCTILEQLHRANPPIIHRDIKPSNLIITSFNHVVLLDFNAAKHYSTGRSADTMLLGTQGYAAPEQYGFGVSTPLTDIYSVGILLREMTSVLPTVPESFVQIIDKCTKIDPINRYDSAASLREALLLTSSSSQPPSEPISHTFSQQLSPPVMHFKMTANGDTHFVNSSTSSASNPQDNTLRRFLAPGFRAGKPWKMFISSIIYLFLIWLCFSMDVKDTYGATLWLERTFCFMIFLSAIAGSCNYCNIQILLPLCHNRNRIVHYAGIILLDLLLMLGLLFILFLIEELSPL